MPWPRDRERRGASIFAVVFPALFALAACDPLIFAPVEQWVDGRMWLTCLLLAAVLATAVWIAVALLSIAARPFGLAPLPQTAGLAAVSVVAGLGYHGDRAADRGLLVFAAVAVAFAALPLLPRFVGVRSTSTQERTIFVASALALCPLWRGARAAAAAAGSPRGLVALSLGGLAIVLAALVASRFAADVRRRQALAPGTVGIAIVLFRLWAPNPHDPMILSARAPRATGEAGPDVVLVVLDTCRADALELEATPSSKTPRLAEFARGADVYTEAIANASWTLPGHTSLFTGRRLSGHRTDATSKPGFRARLSSDVPTLQSTLGGAGYATTVIAANRIVGPTTGLIDGFHRARHPGRTWASSILSMRIVGALNRARGVPLTLQLLAGVTGFQEHATADEIIDLATEEIARLDRPLYLCLNLMDFHRPYASSPDVGRAARWALHRDIVRLIAGLEDGTAFTRRHLETIRRDYYGAQTRVDAALGRLFDTLREAGRYDDAIIVVTADHGQSLGDNPNLEHYFGHHGAYEPAVRIPLVVKLPGESRQGRRYEHHVEQADLLPSLLTWLGEPLPEGIDGRPLWQPGRTAVTEWYPRLRSRPGLLPRSRVGVYEGRYKFVREPGVDYLFDLHRSPYEAVDVLADEPAVGERLRAQLVEAVSSPAGETVDGGIDDPIDEALVEQLRALGYVR